MIKTVYIDLSGHMVSLNLDELHKFAIQIGLKREWFQDKKYKHYDLTTKRMINKAIANGAMLISLREIIKILKTNERTNTY